MLSTCCENAFPMCRWMWARKDGTLLRSWNQTGGTLGASRNHEILRYEAVAHCRAYELMTELPATLISLVGQVEGVDAGGSMGLMMGCAGLVGRCPGGGGAP